MRTRSGERGAILLWAVLVLLVFLALASLGIDYGHAFYSKQLMIGAAEGAGRAALAEVGLQHPDYSSDVVDEASVLEAAEARAAALAAAEAVGRRVTLRNRDGEVVGAGDDDLLVSVDPAEVADVHDLGAGITWSPDDGNPLAGVSVRVRREAGTSVPFTFFRAMFLKADGSAGRRRNRGIPLDVQVECGLVPAVRVPGDEDATPWRVLPLAVAVTPALEAWLAGQDPGADLDLGFYGVSHFFTRFEGGAPILEQLEYLSPSGGVAASPPRIRVGAAAPPESSDGWDVLSARFAGQAWTVALAEGTAVVGFLRVFGTPGAGPDQLVLRLAPSMVRGWGRPGDPAPSAAQTGRMKDLLAGTDGRRALAWGVAAAFAVLDYGEFAR